MPGGVLEVRQSERLGLLERLWLPGLLRAFWVIARRFAENLRQGARSPTRQAPQAPHQRPAYVRGMPVLVGDEERRPRCVGCELCAQICPSACIRIAVAPGALSPETAGVGSGPVPSAREDYARIEHFEIDMARCLSCGLCEEVCPADALVMSPLVEIAAFDRASLVFDLDALLVPASLLTRQLGHRRPAVLPSAPETGGGL